MATRGNAKNNNKHQQTQTESGWLFGLLRQSSRQNPQYTNTHTFFKVFIFEIENCKLVCTDIVHIRNRKLNVDIFSEWHAIGFWRGACRENRRYTRAIQHNDRNTVAVLKAVFIAMVTMINLDPLQRDIWNRRPAWVCTWACGTCVDASGMTIIIIIIIMIIISVIMRAVVSVRRIQTHWGVKRLEAVADLTIWDMFTTSVWNDIQIRGLVDNNRVFKSAAIKGMGVGQHACIVVTATVWSIEYVHADLLWRLCGLYVCMCVTMMCVCVYVKSAILCVYVCMCACVHVCMCVCMHVN